MAPEALSSVISGLLAAVGSAAVVSEFEALPAGGNNRVYRVRAGDREFAAKHYFYDAAEQRDRLQAEYGFLEHAWRCGIRCIPRPLAADATAHVALYEFVGGRWPESAGPDRVVEAAKFFAALNTVTSRASGAPLPLAADACLSVEQHVHSVDARIGRLAGIATRSRADHEAAAFIAELAGAWSVARERILRAFPEPGAPISERSLSPSDFGFHNTLVRPCGELCFLDFEYAGWDDPAKMAGDFFWHAGLRPSREHFGPFVETAFAPFDDAPTIERRVRILS